MLCFSELQTRSYVRGEIWRIQNGTIFVDSENATQIFPIFNRLVKKSFNLRKQIS